MLNQTDKKNCYNCKHLEYDEEYSDGYLIGAGYTCMKRDDCGDDITLENNLSRPEYLEKGKVCFEPKVSKS